MTQASAAAAKVLSDRQYRGRLLAALTAGVLALLVMVGTAVWLVGKAREYSGWVDHTYAAEAKVYRLQSLLERTETARRGYLLLPTPDTWRAYEASASLVPDALRDLASFTADNPVQARNVAELRPVVERLIGMMTEMMALAETGDRNRALDLFRDGRELQPMQQARDRCAAMAAEEQRLLGVRAGTQSGYSNLLLTVMLVGAVLLALLAGGSLWTLRRYGDDLRRSEEALRRLNFGLEDQVRVRTADLTRANEEIQRFAYIVSHDLRSPLVNILGFTSELELSLKPLSALVAAAAEAKAPDAVSRDSKLAVEQDLPEAIGFIRSSAKKMDRLINAILQLSRQGRRTLNPEPVNMTALARTAADSLQQLAHERGAEIVIEGDLPPLTTDRLSIEQIVSNLMENAVKYAKPGRAGRVAVRGRPEGDRLVYEVEDNGRGIDPKDHERIFDLFRRAGAQDQAGEGIGLANVRALVHRLGGRIAVVSELDRGATFRLSLPQTSPREPEAST